MKKGILLYTACALTLASLTSCDDFLTKDPQDKQTNDTYWSSERSLRTYAQDFYSSYFVGYEQDYVTFGGYYSGDTYSDDFLPNYDSDQYNAGFLYYPTSSINYYNSITSTWSTHYGTVYKANAMLEKIPGMSISEEAKNHWTAVARYFRAMAYSELCKVYGGVPYYDAVTDPADAALYKDRDSYLFVAQKILEDYQYAIANMRADDTRQQVNRYVAAAYMSRDMLFHATWLKYHGTTVGPTSETVSNTDLQALFQGAIDGANVVMNSSGLYQIGNDYIGLFTVDDLYQNPEVVWYREYTSGLACHALMSYMNTETDCRGGVTEAAIESYLCSDGLPIGQSPLYAANTGYATGASVDAQNYATYDPSIQNAFKDRDPRLYQTVADTIRLTNVTGMSFANSPATTGYATKKFLNDQWAAEGSSYAKNRDCPADAPCIRYAEVLLNYLEARYEIAQLGGAALTQDDFDKTINELRARQLTKWGEEPQVARTMPAVTYTGSALSVNGVTINDPNRDPEVDPVLWEIRRERRVELMMEGRRGEDLRRWAKLEYADCTTDAGNPSQACLGAYIKLSDYPKMQVVGDNGNRLLTLYNPADPTNEDATEGYVEYFYNRTGMLSFTPGDLNSERNYLRAIPADQITVYGDAGYTLTQNPGW